jgi:hypothetical protein
MAKIKFIYGGDEDEIDTKEKIPLLPNPFPPDDIYTLIGTVSSVGGLATVAYKLVKLWMDDRKARKITIKKGDIEIEIQGGMGAKEIKNILDTFRKLAKVKNKDEVEITIPKKCDPSLSEDLLKENRK